MGRSAGPDSGPRVQKRVPFLLLPTGHVHKNSTGELCEPTTRASVEAICLLVVMLPNALCRRHDHLQLCPSPALLCLESTPSLTAQSVHSLGRRRTYFILPRLVSSYTILSLRRGPSPSPCTLIGRHSPSTLLGDHSNLPHCKWWHISPVRFRLFITSRPPFRLGHPCSLLAVTSTPDTEPWPSLQPKIH